MAIENNVALNEYKYRKMVPESFVDTVWVINAKTLIFLYISPKKKGIRGYSYEETVGRHIKEVLTPDSYEITKEILQKALQNFHEKINKSYKLEIEVTHKSGKTIWIELNTKIIKEKGEDLKIIGISRNINKRKSAENEKEKLINQLNKALEEKNQLIEKIKIFESLLPICSACRRIRHTDNTWWPLEKYIQEKTGSQLTHTICPDCTKIYYSEK